VQIDLTDAARGQHRVVGEDRVDSFVRLSSRYAPAHSFVRR
jgi:hypothetical protein